MEEDNVVKFPGSVDFEVYPQEADVDIGSVLEGLEEQDLEDLIVIGRNTDGDIYFAATSMSPEKIMWDLERSKYILLQTYT